MARGGWVLAIAAVAALGLGIAARQWLAPPAAPADADPRPLLAASMPDLEGRSRSLSEWQGKVLLVNFWATWCAPCKEEIPDLVALQSELGARGLQVVGIAIDQPEAARAFAVEAGMNYPSLVGGYAGVELARTAGNKVGGLPYSVVIDRQGKLVATTLGVIKPEGTRKLLSDLLAQGQ